MTKTKSHIAMLLYTVWVFGMGAASYKSITQSIEMLPIRVVLFLFIAMLCTPFWWDVFCPWGQKHIGDHRDK